jgi:hypothetical protein
MPPAVRHLARGKAFAIDKATRDLGCVPGWSAAGNRAQARTIRLIA